MSEKIDKVSDNGDQPKPKDKPKTGSNIKGEKESLLSKIKNNTTPFHIFMMVNAEEETAIRMDNIEYRILNDKKLR